MTIAETLLYLGLSSILVAAGALKVVPGEVVSTGLTAVVTMAIGRGVPRALRKKKEGEP